MKKLTDQEFVKLMVDKELEIVGTDIRYNDLIAEPEKYKNWFQDYAFDTVEQYGKWKQFYWQHFYDKYPKRVKDIAKYFSWFTLQYGLKYNFSWEELNEYEDYEKREKLLQTRGEVVYA